MRLKYTEKKHSSRSWTWLLLSGVACGAVPFVSMLPSIAALCLSVRNFFCIKSHQERVLYVAAALVGFTPLLIYNKLHFGHPLLQANVAGNWDDTFFRPSWDFFTHHLSSYTGFGGVSLLLYAPAVPLGTIGLTSLWKHQKDFVILCIVFAIFHLGFILNIEAIGYCQYGPRFLFPFLPLFSLGLVEVFTSHPSIPWRIIRELAILSVPYAICVNAFGAIGGTMYCDIEHFAFPAYFTTLLADPFRELYLAPYLIFPTLVLGVLFFIRVRSSRATPLSDV